MTTNQCVTDGGLPDGWTNQNLLWLAQAHRHHARAQAVHRRERAYWHIRWAAFIEDILETRDVPYY